MPSSNSGQAAAPTTTGTTTTLGLRLTIVGFGGTVIRTARGVVTATSGEIGRAKNSNIIQNPMAKRITKMKRASLTELPYRESPNVALLAQNYLTRHAYLAIQGSQHR
jgi:hypothetical protein